MGYALLRFICFVLCVVCLLSITPFILMEAQTTLAGLPGWAAFSSLGLAAIVNVLRLYDLQGHGHLQARRRP